MTDTPTIDAAITNPEAHYQQPDDVLADSSLSKQEKIDILVAWKVNAEQLQESEQEGMTGGENDKLSTVVKALLSLGWTDSA